MWVVEREIKQIKRNDMNGFTIFNNRLFGNNEDITWYGRKGVMKIDDERRATILLTTNGNRDYYVGYEVAIKNKEDGTVDYHRFYFNDYFTKDDNVSDRDGGYLMISYAAKDWYKSVPSNEAQDRFTAEILDYIQQWN